MNGLAPKEIVTELDRYIVGQGAAKRAVAIALRNRWRRQQVGAEMRDDIHPKNGADRKRFLRQTHRFHRN